MKNTATVFTFNIWFKNSNGTIEHDFTQTRLVVAQTEEEAESKLNAYREQLVANGFCDFVYVCKGVELDEVII